MTRFSNEIDELLSCYLDGECDAAEKAAAEKLLESNADAADYLQELAAMRVDLQSISRHRIGRDLSAAIIAQAREKAGQMGLASSHHLLVDFTGHKPSSNSPLLHEKSSQQNRIRLGIYCCALAASVLLAVAFFKSRGGHNEQGLVNPDLMVKQDSHVDVTPFDPAKTANPLEQSIASSNLPIEPANEGTRTVGKKKSPEIDFMRLVVDVSVAANAWNNNVLGTLLENANIRTGNAILADQPMLASLEKSLMILSSDAGKANVAQTSRVALLYVEAPAIALDRVISLIYARDTDFPQVAMNIAIVQPDVELFTLLRNGVAELRNELASVGAASAAMGSALPIVLSSQETLDAAGLAQFSGSALVPRYVSRTDRTKGWPVANSPSADMNPRSEAIFVIRQHAPQ